MSVPARILRQTGRHALVDGIHFQLPVASQQSPALLAAFTINRRRAARLLPGNELHPLAFGSRGLLVVTVIDYRVTNIGRYIEYSVAIACTRGARPAPPILPLLFQRHYEVGQYVVDLPVSTEISVKGGKGIWGMPKHRANLDFLIGPDVVSSQYDLDGQMVMRIDVERPGRTWLSLNTGGANFCEFRGMLMKSYIYFKGRIGFSLFRAGSATITLGPSRRADWLRDLDIGPRPVFSGFFPETRGVLDDHFECWFISSETPFGEAPEGLESVVNLGQGQAWLPAPARSGPAAAGVATSAHEMIFTAMRSASAAIVREGFSPMARGTMAPSATYNP